MQGIPAKTNLEYWVCTILHKSSIKTPRPGQTIYFYQQRNNAHVN